MNILKNAVTIYNETQDKDCTEFSAETCSKMSIPSLRSKLAVTILNNVSDNSLVSKQAKAACIELPIDGLFYTVIVKFFLDEKKSSEYLSSTKCVISGLMENVYRKHKFNGISAFISEDCLILHLFVQPCEKNLFTEETLNRFFNDASGIFENLGRFVVSVGKMVQGLPNVLVSYETAEQALGKASFTKFNSIIFYDKTLNNEEKPTNEELKKVPGE